MTRIITAQFGRPVLMPAEDRKPKKPFRSYCQDDLRERMMAAAGKTPKKDAPTPKPKDENHLSPTAQRILALLDFAAAPVQQTSQLALAVGASKSSVNGHMSNLTKRGLIIYTAPRGKGPTKLPGLFEISPAGREALRAQQKS